MNDITTFYSELLIIRHTFQHAGGPIPDALEDLLKTVGKVARCAARRKPGKREPEETGRGSPESPAERFKPFGEPRLNDQTREKP